MSSLTIDSCSVGYWIRSEVHAEDQQPINVQRCCSRILDRRHVVPSPCLWKFTSRRDPFVQLLRKYLGGQFPDSSFGRRIGFSAVICRPDTLRPLRKAREVLVVEVQFLEREFLERRTGPPLENSATCLQHVRYIPGNFRKPQEDVRTRLCSQMETLLRCQKKENSQGLEVNEIW